MILNLQDLDDVAVLVCGLNAISLGNDFYKATV
jgi:hypothetical protein